MTVQQLIDRLAAFPKDALVYVPIAQDGSNGTVQFVAEVPHTDIPIPGIRISNDVALLPGMMEHFILPDDASDEDRQGES